MIKYMAYVSRQSYIISDDEINDLLNTSRHNNSLNQITGLLLFFDGTFIQYIEGPDDVVDGLFKKICVDRRHRDIVLLLEDTITNRVYTEWSMAYKKITVSEVKNIEGLKEFNKEDLFKIINPENEHPGIVLLKSFVNNLHI